MKDGVPGLPISQGGNWDVTEHGFGGLYGQTAFSSRPAGAPPVDPRFVPGAPLVAGLQPHYAVSVGAPAPAPSSLGGAALPFVAPALSPVVAVSVPIEGTHYSDVFAPVVHARRCAWRTRC